MNLFYPPFVTYLPLIIKLFESNPAIALKIFAGFCIVLSGISMYQFVFQVTKKRSIALFSALFYLIAPYKLANVYKRFAIGEFTAMVFMPYVFLGIYNLFEQDGKKHYFIAIGAIGLMLSHTITTLYTALFCIAYILFNYKKLKEKDIIKKCIINVIFILLVTMLFWLPLLEAKTKAEYGILDSNVMRTNGEFTSGETISLSQLFKDKGEENGTTFLLGLPTLFAIILTVFVSKHVDTRYKSFYIISIIFSIVSIFMASKFFPWIIMPELICKLQYPWRMIGYANLFLSFVCGINLYEFLKNIKANLLIKNGLIVLFTVLSIISSLSIQSQFFTKDKELDNKYLSSIPKDKKISHKSINRDYMPLKALKGQNTFVFTRKDTTYILNGQAEIENENKQDLKDEVIIKGATKDTIFEFPYYYYPGYKIMLQTQNEEINLAAVESEHGYLSCSLPKDVESGTLKVAYVRYFYYIFFLYYIWNFSSTIYWIYCL